MTFISRKQGKKCLKMRGTSEQRQFWGTGKLGNQYFDFEEQVNKAINFRGTGTPLDVLFCVVNDKRKNS